MKSGENIKRYSAEELRAMRARGDDRTDWPAVRATTEEALEASIASDPDWADVPRDWYKNAMPVKQSTKKLVSVRIDDDVLTWFRAQGAGYQTRMNSVLRAYMLALRSQKTPARETNN